MTLIVDRSPPSLPVALLAALFAAQLGACGEDRTVGQMCSLGGEPPPDPSGTLITLTSPAPGCAADLCLRLPLATGEEPPEGLHPLPSDGGLCTAECRSDADCEMAAESPCVTGFTCAVPLTVGSACCKRLCLCNDYALAPAERGSVDPAACDPDNPANACCNLEGRVGQYPNCPRVEATRTIAAPAPTMIVGRDPFTRR